MILDHIVGIRLLLFIPLYVALAVEILGRSWPLRRRAFAVILVDHVLIVITYALPRPNLFALTYWSAITVFWLVIYNSAVATERRRNTPQDRY